MSSPRRTKPAPSQPKAAARPDRPLALASALLASVASGCAADPGLLGSGNGLATDPIAAQQLQATAAKGVRISFHYSDYYSITNPNPNGCAGDARFLYDPLALTTAEGSSVASIGFGASSIPELQVAAGVTGPTGPLRLPLSAAGDDETIRPSFVKNVSVDMTDANANTSLNSARSCSVGNGPSAPPVSSCATFDYGAIGGIPTTMGGSLLLIGGVQGYNYAGMLPAGTLQTTFPFQGHAVSCGPVKDTTGTGGASPIVPPIGFTSCGGDMFTLGVNTLPASVFTTNPDLVPGLQGSTAPTGPISTWAHLSGVAGYAGPRGAAGATANYSAGTQQVLLFGGASPLAGMASTGPGMTTYDTWSFDLKAQAWTSIPANFQITPKLMSLYDTFLDIQAPGAAPADLAPISVQIAKSVGARALFGYVAVPGMGRGLASLSTGGAMGAGAIDLTERILAVGGFGTVGTITMSHRFNPTFGPEAVDILPNGVTDKITVTGGGAGSMATDASTTSAPNSPLQWIDSHHTQALGNTYGMRFPASAGSRYTNGSSNFAPDLPPLAAGPTGGDAVFNASYAPLVNASAVNGLAGTGYVAAAGGFTAAADGNVAPTTAGALATIPLNAGCTTDGTDDATKTTLECGGGLSVLTRFRGALGANDGDDEETKAANWSMAPNFTDTYAVPHAPAAWTQIPEDTTLALNRTVPFVGGATLLPGFNLAQNDLVYFGGLNCKRYVDDASADCSFFPGNPTANMQGNPGRYWSFSDSPGDLLTANSAAALADQRGTNWSTPPKLAGMAAARGLDPAGNVIIVAWGGAKQGATTDGTGNIYYLHNQVAAAAPNTKQWVTVSANAAAPNERSVATSDGRPAELVNAAMVFSHVTRKFYVFGGHEPVSGITSAVTWELSISGGNAATGCHGTAGVNDACVFTWRKLRTDGAAAALSCYPSCPQARRSHRMTEVNYYNRNPGGINDGTFGLASGEQACAAGAPCSYGIFMEGGSPDGFHFLSDRWMFDPTANGGAGHWQRVDDFPPRTLAAMATTEYTLPNTGAAVQRAILFGGETGMHSPEMAAKRGATTQYFVPPTLGDTWMFDYANKTWQRVELLGKGYNGAARIPTGSELERRQAFDAGIPSTFRDSGSGAPIDYAMGTAAQEPSDAVGSTHSTYSELSPPPLAGGIMVTRTMGPPASATDTTLSPLKIPEVYLFGGRLKDGSMMALDHVYKFCAGSTGEMFKSDASSVNSYPNELDFACDAFDATANPNSPSPQSGYVGRWLRKAPSATAGLTLDKTASFMGAGAYDSVRDRILVVGGLTPAPAGVSFPTASQGIGSVTDRASLTLNSSAAEVLEYTPPQRQIGGTVEATRQGQWTSVPACTGTGFTFPAARYGHSLAYDTLNRGLVMTGGYDIDGEPLTQEITLSDGRAFEIPEVWAATHYATDIDDGTTNLRNPGVVIANAPCYYWKPINTFGSSFDIPQQSPPREGLAHAASVYIPATGFNTGFYTMLDNACEKAGPVFTPDPEVNKLLAGGAYIDIERSALGANENLILNLTYIPMGTRNLRPDAKRLTAGESAVFRIHLVKTGQTGDALRSVLQPRHLFYADSESQFPQVAQSISVLAPPTGQVAQEQVLIPLAVDPAIDRIRIERVSGTGILLDATLFRTGNAGGEQ